MEEVLHNDKVSVKMRRNRSTLGAVGTGVLFLSLWNVLKSVSECILGDATLIDVGIIDDFYIFIIVIATIVLTWDAVLRLYIGARARRDAKGRKTSLRYLFAAGIAIFNSVVSFLLSWSDLVQFGGNSLMDFMEIFIDITSIFLLVELIVSSVSIRIHDRRAAARG